MHRTAFTLSILLSGFALARPQLDGSELSGLPACVQDAANAALGSTGCPLNDKECICRSTAFINAITTTVTQHCTAPDVASALNFAQTFCGAYIGASPSSSTAPADPGAATTPTASSDTGASGGAASTTTVPGGTVTSMTTVVSASPSASMSVSTIPTSMANATTSGVMVTTSCTTITLGSTPTVPYSATYTGAAATVVKGRVGQGIMAAVVGIAGAVAWL